jgi:putative DNA primase/helicase
MMNIVNPVAECTQFYIDPDEERHNELMTEENWEILKKLPNKLWLAVDNTTTANVDTPQQLTELRLKLQATGYHPVPVIGKAVKMPAWQTRCLGATPQQISNWSYSQSDCKSTGILCGQTVGVDIDVLDEELSGILAACAARMLGATSLRRIGKAPKTLLMYRVEIPHDKQQTPELLIGDVKAKVEILAKGQQFVAFGIHPDTKAPYHWPEKSPLDIAVADVPLVTLESLRQFVAEAEKILRAAGGRTAREIKDEIKEQEQQGNAAAGIRKNEKPSREKIADALDHIVNDLDYLDWIKVGFALYDGLGESGRDLWESWSATYPDNDPDVTADKWKSFANGRSVKIATLFWYAKENGWWWKDGADEVDVKPGDRPTIKVVGGKLPEIVTQAEQALIKTDLGLYQRGSMIVRPALMHVEIADLRPRWRSVWPPFIRIFSLR